MGRRVGIAATHLLLSMWAFGPEATGAQIALRGGVNLTDFFGEDVGDTQSRTGLNVGAAFPLFEVGPIQVIAEGYYRQKGARTLVESQQSALAGEIVEFGIDYVEVPVLARFNLPVIAGRALPYLAAGPAFGWKIDCGVTSAASTDSGLDCDDLAQDNLGTTLRNYEQGLVIGGGFDLAVLGGRGALNLDARLTRGLSRLNESDEGPDVRNQALSVMLGYSFGLSRSFPTPGSGLPAASLDR